MRAAIVRLDRGACEFRDLEPEVVNAFVGGRGVGVKLVYDLLPPGTDPLSPACPVVLSCGPLTGAPFPMGGWFAVTSKSPLTGTILTAPCGGRTGVYLKRNAIDALVLTGSAAEPLYVYVEAGQVRLLSASHLWGKDKAHVKEDLRERHGRDISILLIGVAGEGQVPFANVESDGRPHGRGGLGALFGSKLVKAIVVKARGKSHVPRDEGFSFVAYECRKWLAANPVTSKALPEFGTGVFLSHMRDAGILSERNFRFPPSAETSRISGESLTALLHPKRKACLFCPVACGRATVHGAGPEYDALWSLGVNLCIHDIDKVAGLNALCNELGLDATSTGNVIGMALELGEAGRMKLPARYGDADGVAGLISHIASRQEEGAMLSQGTGKLGENFHAQEIAAHCKGMEIPAFDPRGAWGNALGYATSNRGACYEEGYLVGAEMINMTRPEQRRSPLGKGSLLALYQNLGAFMDTLVMCRMSLFAVPHDYYSRIASTALGRRITWEDSMKAGERIWNLERLFNLREGVGEDVLPPRFTEVPLDELLAEYYSARGWDEKGVPGRETLNKMGLL